MNVCDGQHVAADSRILIDLVCGSERASVSTKSLSMSLFTLDKQSLSSCKSLRNIHDPARVYLNAKTSSISCCSQV